MTGGGSPAAKEYTYNCRVACIIGTYALSEELSKFYMFRRRLKKIEGEHTWLDLIVFIRKHKNDPKYTQERPEV